MVNVSDEIKTKGYSLYNSKKVEKILETDKRIHFKVTGETENHSIIFDKQKNKWECDCRYSTLQRKECSHVIACKILNNET
jgi:hypothetical protein